MTGFVRHRGPGGDRSARRRGRRSRRASLRFAAFAILLQGLAALSPCGAQVPSALEQGAGAYAGGRFEDAIPLLETALAADPLLREGYLMLAFAHMQLGRLLEAEAVAGEGLARFPDLRSLRVPQAEAAFERQEYETARAIYEELQPYAWKGELPGVTGEQVQARLGSIYEVLAASALNDGDNARAEELYAKAVSHPPVSVDAYNNLAYLQVQRDDLDAADTTVGAGLRDHPDAASLLRIRAVILNSREDYEGLLGVLERLHELEPGDIDIALNYGELLRADGRHDRANDVFAELLERHPGERRVYEHLVEMNDRAFNYKGALTVLRLQQAEFPDDDGVVRRIAGIYEAMKEWDAARAVYDTLATLYGQERDAGFASALTYERQDTLDAAAAAYRDLAARYPTDGPILTRLGFVLEEEGRWADALPVYERLAAADSASYALIRLGWVNEKLGRVDEARSLYEIVTRFGDPDPLPYYRRSDFALEAGDHEEAFALAERALEKSLNAVEDSQKRLVRFVEKTPEGEGEGDGGESPRADDRGFEGPLGLKERAERVNRLTEEIYGFFVSRFPVDRVEATLGDLIDRYEGSARLHHMVGAFHFEHGNIEAARHHLREAVEFAPSSQAAQLSLGELHESQGEDEKAILAYERALSLDEEDPEAYGHLIRLYQRRGRLDELCDRWLSRYRTTRGNPALIEALIDALHRAGRVEEAAELLASSREDTAEASP